MAIKEHALEIKNSLSTQLQRIVDLNSEPGASSWLLALPLQDQGFHLTKTGVLGCTPPALWLEFTEYS